MKKNNLITILVMFISVQLLAQKSKTFSSVNVLGEEVTLSVTLGKNLKDAKFEIRNDDGTFTKENYIYQGKDSKGQDTWKKELEKPLISTSILTLLKGSGLKIDISTKGKVTDTKVTYYYGDVLQEYKADKERIFTIITSEKVIVGYENPNNESELSGDFTVKEEVDLVKLFTDKKDFTISVFKFLDLDEKEIKLTFKNDKKEIHWQDADGKKKVFKLSK